MTDHIEELRKRGMITSLAKVPGAKADSIEVLRGAVARGWCSPENAGKTVDPVLAEAIVQEVIAAIAAMGGRGEDCHCATCTCASGMTPAIRFDASPAEREGAVRDQLIAMGWTPPHQPEARAGGEVKRYGDLRGTYAATPPPSAPVGVGASYHPCTSILIEGLRRLEGGSDVLAEWDRARAKADTALAAQQAQCSTEAWRDLAIANGDIVDEIREIVGLKGKPGDVVEAVRKLAAP